MSKSLLTVYMCLLQQPAASPQPQGFNLDIVWKTLTGMGASFLARLPYIIIGIIVLVFFIIIGRIIKRLILTAGERARLDVTLADLLGRITSAVLIIFGVFVAAGIEMSPTRAAATILENPVLRPSLFRLLMAGDGAGHLAEVKVTSSESENQTLAALALKDCVVVALRRSDRLIAPNGNTRLLAGDVLTLLGSEAAIEKARARLSISG